MSRTSTHVIGANIIATATQDQVEAAIAYINRRLLLDASLVHCRSLSIGFRGAITYFAEGIGTTRIGELECLTVSAGPSRATWGIINCNPLLRRALKQAGVNFIRQEAV